MHSTLIPEPIKLTYEDYCALPDDGRRYEILDGDLYMSPSPEVPHQNVIGNLLLILTPHVRRLDLGKVFVAPLDVILDKHNILEPDVLFVAKDRLSIVTRKNIQGAPDLVVEVLSPSTSYLDLRDKRNIYARCGVPFYWIVDPDARTLLELQLTEGAYATVGSHGEAVSFSPRLFPKLTIDLNQLWE